jgi:hypothetical protein
MLKTAHFLTLLLLSAPSVFADCTCRKIEKGETTHWGGNQLIVQVEEKPYRELRGLILDHSGYPMDGALVEVWTNPEYLLREGPQTPDEKAKQRRLKACRTSAQGIFCIRVKPGRYEVRVSIGPGWDVTEAYIIIDSLKGQKAELMIQMHVGV